MVPQNPLETTYHEHSTLTGEYQHKDKQLRTQHMKKHETPNNVDTKKMKSRKKRIRNERRQEKHKHSFVSILS